MIRKILYKIRLALLGVILGMKKAEDETLHQSGIQTGDGSSIDQQVADHSVAKALLRGEVTQEVKELRYRTYLIDREAKHFNYFSPLLAKKKGVNDFKFVSYEDSDRREVVTIQNNRFRIENVLEGLSSVSDGVYTDPERATEISVAYDFCPTFQLGNYVTKVVVKKGDSDYDAVLDLYVSEYDCKSADRRPFVNAVKSCISTGVPRPFLEIASVEFTTKNAYRVDDMLHFKFGEPRLERIMEYDGSFVLRYFCNVIDGGTDLTAEFYDEKMAEKYAANAPRPSTIDYDPRMRFRTYKCSCCGKEVSYIPSDVDDMDPSEESSDGSVTEYFDYEVAEATYGVMLCKDCAAKREAELMEGMAGRK